MQPQDIALLVGGPPRVEIEDIVRHPRLPEARKVYFDRFLAVYGGDPFLVRLLIETGRFAIFTIAAVLEAAQDPAQRETWLTVGHLKRQMSTYGLASERHVDHLIGRLCEVGFMELRPSEADRRVRILKATEKLWSHDLDWLVAHYMPLAVLYPQHDYGPVMRRDHEFQLMHRRMSVPFMALGAGLLTAEPDMNLFLNRAGGFMVLAALLQAALAEPDHLHAAVPYADVGERFGISRTQVRKLLVAAEEAGLVTLPARGGRRVEILPRLWASADRGIAGGMYFHDLVFLAAARAMAPIHADAQASVSA